MVICPKWAEITINMVIKLHLETVTWIDIIIRFENFAPKSAHLSACSEANMLLQLKFLEYSQTIGNIGNSSWI